MSIQPSIFYKDPKAAIRFLEKAFGFELTFLIDGEGDDDRLMHSELACGGDASICVGGEWAEWVKSPLSVGGGNTQSLKIQIEGDIDAHCARSRAAGAVIVAEPETQFYGNRVYRAQDPEGHLWTFSQHVKDVSIEDMERAIGQKFKHTL